MSVSSVIRVITKRFRRSSNFTRAHERMSCSAVGEVIFIERGCVIRGIVDEVSRGGVRLRPAHSFIVTRMGEDVDVRVSFGRFDLGATLVNTSAQGYGFKLKQLLTSEDFAEIVSLNTP